MQTLYSYESERGNALTLEVHNDTVRLINTFEGDEILVTERPNTAEGIKLATDYMNAYLAGMSEYEAWSPIE